MTLLDRFILKTIIPPFLFGVMIFVSIFLVDIFMQLLDLAARRNLSYVVLTQLFVPFKKHIILAAVPKFLYSCFFRFFLKTNLPGIAAKEDDFDLVAIIHSLKLCKKILCISAAFPCIITEWAVDLEKKHQFYRFNRKPSRGYMRVLSCIL